MENQITYNLRRNRTFSEASEDNTIFKNGDLTATPIQTITEQLGEAKINKLKKRARRISGIVNTPDKRDIKGMEAPLSPRKTSKSKKNKAQKVLEESAKECIDIRKFWGDQSALANSSQQNVLKANTSNNQIGYKIPTTQVATHFTDTDTEGTTNINTSAGEKDIRHIKQIMASHPDVTTEGNEKELGNKIPQEENEVTFKDNHEHAKEGKKGNGNGNTPTPLPRIELSPENAKMMDMLTTLLNSHKDELKAEMTKTEGRITALETSKTSVSEIITSIQNLQEELKTENAELKTEVTELKSQISMITNSMIRHSDMIQEMRDNKEVEDIHT